MKKNKLLLIPGVGLSVFHSGASTAMMQSDSAFRPNIILILADDLGYGETGCYGQQKIETPNIDRLAAEGMRFTQHYSSSPVSAPARCSLLTGLHSGHSQIRGNDEWTERGDVYNYRAMLADSTLEGQRPMADNTVTIAGLFKEAGYRTAMTGKWGLGAPHTGSIPDKSGFDYFYGYNCQRQAHTYYPVHLYENTRRVLMGNDTVPPHTGLEPGVNPLDPESYRKFTLHKNAGDAMEEAMFRFLEQNNPALTGEPIFLYWASPVSHVPIQAEGKWLDYYRNKFGPEEPYTGSSGYFPCLTPRAAYAAMISGFDEQIGRLLEWLEKEGISDNTLIIFTSDNGPSFSGGTDAEWFNSNGIYAETFGRSKGFVYEGGIRVPMIACWPGKIKPGTISNHISAFHDYLPTLCQVAGADATLTDGISFLPELLGKKQPSHKHLYWELHEYGGQQAVRCGKWKGIRGDIFKGNMTIELYNLKKDPGELNNLAGRRKNMVRKMERLMRESHAPAAIETFRFNFSGKQ